MKIKKSRVVILALPLILGGGAFLAIKFFSHASSTNQVSNTGFTIKPAHVDPREEVVIKPLLKPGQNQPPTNIPSPSAKDIKLQALHEEIKMLSDLEISDQAKNIKARIHEDNLIYRLNEDLVSEEERKDANDLLTRLALLGVEKAKRGLDAMKPELKNLLNDDMPHVDQ